MREPDGTVKGMLASLEDLFNERMCNDSSSPLQRHGLLDFDIEVHEATEVKIDFKAHWELPQFAAYSPVFMLRCSTAIPAEGDAFTFYIVFGPRRPNELDRGWFLSPGWPRAEKSIYLFCQE
jgi:hypothetical protein